MSLRQNNGLYGYGLVSGGAIGGLVGGRIKDPGLLELNAKIKQDRKDNNRAFTAQAKQLRREYKEAKKAMKPVTARSLAARKRAEVRREVDKELAGLQVPMVAPLGSGLVGMGAQSYYGGRRRMK